MKKIFIILAIIIIIVCIIAVRYYSYKVDYNMILEENAEYEQYKDKEIYGIDLGTLINKTVDKNTKNEIEKDENGNFIPNDSNSIEMDIYIKDNETTYKMEVFYNNDTAKFIQYYGNVKFKYSKIEYHEKTGRVKYLLFEQL